METFEFYVRGRGRFPVDMLRYDCCFPADGMSAEAIINSSDGVRTVRLRRAGRNATNAEMITPARWASFGWSCSETNVWE